ncbi:MAG UNVERIFIED_CONTAM: carbohydrate porin [Microcystis novacekii LVE1205-3]
MFYKYQVTDNISITPGVIWISAPEQFKGTGNEWIGTVCWNLYLLGFPEIKPETPPLGGVLF